LTFETVRSLGLELPRAEASSAYGAPALKVNGQLFACIAVNKSAEPGTLAVRVPFDQRDNLLAEEPDVYYLTDHYADHPFVLVRLGRIRVDALRGLLQMAHRFAATDRRKRGNTRRRADKRGR